MTEPVWIFGYGSLIWRPNVPYAARVPGRISGYARRFYQGSTDHRGVPGRPGRVVTLLPDPDSEVVGVAYRLESSAIDRTMAALDHREKGGYERRNVAVHPLDGQDAIDALVYIATTDNTNYLGPASTADIAAQVAAASGPSGDNVEYVVELARALRALGVNDEHVFDIAAHLRAKV